MLKLAKDYDKSLEEEEKMTAEQLEIKNVGKVMERSVALDNLLLLDNLIPFMIWPTYSLALLPSCSLAEQDLLSCSHAHPVSSDRPQAAPGGEG